jgi:RES domain-containing protein
VLIVPSVVARAEFNAVVNPVHPDAKHLLITEPQPVVWDERLFAMPR